MISSCFPRPGMLAGMGELDGTNEQEHDLGVDGLVQPSSQGEELHLGRLYVLGQRRQPLQDGLALHRVTLIPEAPGDNGDFVSKELKGLCRRRELQSELRVDPLDHAFELRFLDRGGRSTRREVTISRNVRLAMPSLQRVPTVLT